MYGFVIEKLDFYSGKQMSTEQFDRNFELKMFRFLTPLYNTELQDLVS